VRKDAPLGSRTAVFGLLIRDVSRPRGSALAVRAGTSCAQVVAAMRAAEADAAPCVFVTDAAGRPVGMVTPGDVARRIAFRVPPETPVEAVMTAPVFAVARRDYLYGAISAMRRHALHQVPVVDRDGCLAGVLLLDEALAAIAPALLRQIERLGGGDTPDGLRGVKAAQIELAEELLAEELPATEVQQLLTHINNNLYCRAGEAALQAMAEEGWGSPPVHAATIVMGSGGRGENYLLPDQDNGFIIAAYPDEAHSRIDAFFRELAARLCRDLNEVGIPYCNGYCMAVNPLWRKTLPQWIAQIGAWTRRGSTVAVRLADIFFDFQAVWGERQLARDLRTAVTGLVRDNRGFLRQMYQDKLERGSALGLFGGFVIEREKREYRGQVNLKYSGTLPLVSGIRLLALREGIEETSTLARIAALADRRVLDENERGELSQAFGVVTDVLLRWQLADWRAGRRLSYYVDPDALPKARRKALLAALKSIHALRKRAHLEFTAHVF